MPLTKKIINLKTKSIIFCEKFHNLKRKMDFYLTTSVSTFPCFQINWYYNGTIATCMFKFFCGIEIVWRKSTLEDAGANLY